jgi:ubiquinone biosynthesis protein
LETAASTPPDLAYDKFEAEVAVLVERVSGANARDFQVANFVVGLFDIQRRFRIIGTTAFTMAIVSLLVFEGIAKDVDADLDFQREAHPFVLRASIRPCPRESLVIDELQLDVASLEARFYAAGIS